MEQEIRSRKLEARSQKQKARNKRKSCFLSLASCIMFLVSCIVFTGCASEQKEIKPAAGYFELLNEMTKHKKVIDNLDSKLFVYATYKSWPLREAYVEEYARRYQMDDNQKEKLKEKEMGLDEKFNEFFIAVYTPDEKWNDFDRPLSIWKIYMEDEKGERLSPIEIKKVDADSPLVREFYPYLDLWSSTYIVKFPKYIITGEEPFPGKDTNYFRLKITGVVGNAVLEWQLE